MLFSGHSWAAYGPWASGREAEGKKSSSFCHGSSSCYFPEEMLLVLPWTQRIMPQDAMFIYIFTHGVLLLK